MIGALPYALLAKGAYHRARDIDVGSFRARIDDSPLGKCLSIAGTDDIETALTDIEALVPIFAREIEAWVPGSFLKAVTGAMAEIQTIRQFPPIRVLLGHSLGGVLAILTGACLCAAGLPPKAIFAFAPPRSSVGNRLTALFATHGVTLQLYRLGEDVVPNLPPGFDHPVPLGQLGRANSLLGDHDLDHIIAALQVAEVSA